MFTIYTHTNQVGIWKKWCTMIHSSPRSLPPAQALQLKLHSNLICYLKFYAYQTAIYTWEELYAHSPIKYHGQKNTYGMKALIIVKVTADKRQIKSIRKPAIYRHITSTHIRKINLRNNQPLQTSWKTIHPFKFQR